MPRQRLWNEPPRGSSDRAIRSTFRLLRGVNRVLTRAARRRERNAGRRWMAIIVVLLGLAVSWIITGRLMQHDIQQAPSKAAPQH